VAGRPSKDARCFVITRPQKGSGSKLGAVIGWGKYISVGNTEGATTKNNKR
jgi:hypothetical protein